MDVDEERLAVMDSLARALVASEGTELAIESTLDQREALTGADFVIVAIAVGGMPAWESDIEIPGRHGVFMHIADSIGPGGMLRAFRNLPIIDSICRDLADVSPGAWVFNYTNPASAVAAVLRDAPAVRFASLCSCTGTPSDPAWLAELAGVAPEDLLAPVPVAGLNHCAGITELRLRDGRDAMPLVRARAEEPVVRWVIDTFGVIPYCWAHWVEFFPQLQRLEEPYAGRAQGLAMRYGRRIYVMDESAGARGSGSNLAARWSLPEHCVRGQPGQPPERRPRTRASRSSTSSSRCSRTAASASSSTSATAARSRTSRPTPSSKYRPWLMATASDRSRQARCESRLPAHLRLHQTTQELTVQAALSGDRQLALRGVPARPAASRRRWTPSRPDSLLDDMLAPTPPSFPALRVTSFVHVASGRSAVYPRHRSWFSY